MLVSDHLGLPQKEGEIGIEIEMEGKHVSRVRTPAHWKTTGDGSLRGDSAEWVLKAPIKRDQVKDKLNYLNKRIGLAEATLKPSHRCGVHIHINCTELTCQQVINFAVLYLILEELIMTYCDPVRSGNMFCLRSIDADAVINVIIEAIEQNNLNRFNTNDIRYAGLNLSALSKHGSLEFRSLQTPTDFNVIETWINIILAVKDASLIFDNSRDMVEGISAQGGIHFAHHVFGDLIKHLDVRFSDEMIMMGLRNVQDVAYTTWGSKVKHKKDIMEEVRRVQDRRLGVAPGRAAVVAPRPAHANLHVGARVGGRAGAERLVPWPPFVEPMPEGWIDPDEPAEFEDEDDFDDDEHEHHDNFDDDEDDF